MSKKNKTNRHIIELVGVLLLFAALAVMTASEITIEPLILGFAAIAYVAANIAYSATQRVVSLNSIAHHLATAALGVFILLSL